MATESGAKIGIFQNTTGGLYRFFEARQGKDTSDAEKTRYKS